VSGRRSSAASCALAAQALTSVRAWVADRNSLEQELPSGLRVLFVEIEVVGLRRDPLTAGLHV
jgi:hypothetical protein